MLRIFYDEELNVLNSWTFDTEPFGAEEMKKRLGIQNSLHKDFEVEYSGAVKEFSLDSETNLVIEYKEPQPTPYNSDTLISWAMSQLFAAELIPHFAAFLDFANKGTDASAANFRAYAAAVSQSIMAEQIVAKAIELGANIEEVE